MREVLAWVRRAIGLGLALTVLLCCSACTERQDASVEAPARAEQGSLPAGEPGNAAEPAAEYPADGFYVKDGQICLIRGGKPVQTAEDGSFQGYAYRCYGEDGLCSVDAELLATADGQLYHLIDGMPDTQEGLLELDGALYCRQSGGILLRDGDWQTLHFGASGRYTSGNVTIDRYIDGILSECTTEDMTQEERCLACHRFVSGGVVYRANNDHVPQGADCTLWCEENMLRLMEQDSGNCYCYAAEMYYLARRLGYWQATAIAGAVITSDYDHSWLEIKLDGVRLVTDPQLAKTRGYDPDQFFMKPYGETVFTYYRPD